jgi:tetratricopeptide (TPR) repeat protein
VPRRPDRRPLVAVTAALALLAATSALAAPSRLQPRAPVPAAEMQAAMASAVARLQREDCPGALAILDPLLSRLDGAARNPVQLLRIPCLGSVGRGDEVAGAWRELAASQPDDPAVRAIGVIVAMQERDFPAAAQRLTVLAEQSPQGLRTINSAVARGVMQYLTERQDFAARKRLFVALARADWQPADRPEMRDSFAQGAIEALLADGQVAEAEAILPRVTMPELLASMAMERLYEPLWPAIEARMGPHGGTAVDRFALSRLETFTRTEGDERARRDAARAFIMLGRFPEAIEVAEKVAIADGMSEDAAATVRYRAQALTAEGHRDRAVALMQPFTALDIGKTPAAVSGLVSLAELLDEAGRPDEALAVARSAQARSGDAISKWGRAWLRRTEVCALSTLGRAADAGKVADDLVANAGDNQAATVEALLCAKRGDDAARVAIVALATQEGASALADQFQPADALWASAPSRLRALWGEFLKRPDVKAAFDRRARILPRTLWPQREPRPIPRRGTDEPMTVT